MSMSASSARQVHTILGGGMRYETAELILSTIPNFELKQKGRILQLFTEKVVNNKTLVNVYVFIQEIQEALDERQNNIDSLVAHNQPNIPLAEPFAFESQVDTDTHPVDLSLKSGDESLQSTIESENHISNETVPLLAAPNERNQSETFSCHREKSSWTSAKHPTNIKTEAITPPKTKRRQSKTPSNSKQKKLSLIPSMRQMTMTQLFDPVDSPKPSTPIKQEPATPTDESMVFMPESLIGLAQPSESDSENEQVNSSKNLSFQNNIPDPMSPVQQMKTSHKRKSISPPLQDETTTDEEENIQNEAILRSPYAGIETEELLYACPMCRNYWLGLPEELRHKEGLTCRHRQRPVVHTPEHFWSLGIPSTQTCIERGYGGVLPPDKPIDRPRRPRRQHQRKLLEQQQQQQDDED